MMWEGSKDNFESTEFAGVVKRYKKMLSEERIEFFDVSDFEYITDHYIDKSQFTNALQVCEIALAQHPNSITVKLKKAQVLISQMKVEKALQLLKMLVEIENNNPEIYLMLGTCYHLQGDGKQALEYFKKVELLSWEDKDEMLYNIGSNYLQVADYQNAVYFLLKAHEDNPENETVLYDLAYCYDKIWDDRNSIKHYNKYLDLDPYSESAWYNLGILYSRREEYDKAIEAYDFALAIDDKYGSALFNKANALSAAERFEEALVCYLEFLKFDKKSAETQLYIAECYLQLEDYENALLYYRNTIQLQPKNADAWYGAGVVMMLRDNFKESIVFFKKAVRIDSKCSDYWIALAKCFASINKYEEALAAFQKTLKLENDNPEFWLSFADFYFQFGMIDLAINTLLNADKKFKTNPFIHYKLAGYLDENEEDTLAKRFLRKALKENFYLNEELLADFSELRTKPWAVKMIKNFKVKNKPL